MHVQYLPVVNRTPTHWATPYQTNRNFVDGKYLFWNRTAYSDTALPSILWHGAWTTECLSCRVCENMKLDLIYRGNVLAWGIALFHFLWQWIKIWLFPVLLVSNLFKQSVTWLLSHLASFRLRCVCILHSLSSWFCQTFSRCPIGSKIQSNSGQNSGQIRWGDISL